MNNTQHEQLFTDLTSAQAEIVTAAATSSITTSYGSATANFKRTGKKSFTADFLNVKDGRFDGKSVYAKFQARATDGTISTTPTARYDNKGAFGGGTTYTGLAGSFNKNIKQLRVLIYRDDLFADPVAGGAWIDF
jgi:hypothetical protein